MNQANIKAFRPKLKASDGIHVIKCLFIREILFYTYDMFVQAVIMRR